MNGRDQLKNIDKDGRVVIKHLKQIGLGGLYCIHLVQDCDQWWALASAVKHSFFKMRVIF
jgi:hypothetical protein